MAVTRDHKTLHLCVLCTDLLQSSMAFKNNCDNRLVTLTILPSHMQKNEFKIFFRAQKILSAQ